MGRQTSVSLSEVDEQEFIDFLRSTAPIQLIRPGANERNFFIDRLPPRETGQNMFLIWNTEFPFEPEVKEAELWNEGPSKERFLISNKAGAPLIEYFRDAYQNPSRKFFGRVYWNTDFNLYRGPDYDHQAFSLWFDRVVRWLRSRGHRVEIAKGWSLYCLPDAWKLRHTSTE